LANVFLMRTAQAILGQERGSTGFVFGDSLEYGSG
jgi:hypothetical protein